VTCGNGGHLPDETPLLGTSGKCYVTISAFDATNKRDANVEQQVRLGMARIGTIIMTWRLICLDHSPRETLFALGLLLSYMCTTTVEAFSLNSIHVCTNTIFPTNTIAMILSAGHEAEGSSSPAPIAIAN
jgi:hypothetical protein